MLFIKGSKDLDEEEKIRFDEAFSNYGPIMRYLIEAVAEKTGLSDLQAAVTNAIAANKSGTPAFVSMLGSQDVLFVPNNDIRAESSHNLYLMRR